MQEHLARDLNLLLLALIESSEDAMFTTGIDGRITSWNATAQRLLGWNRKDALGASAAQLANADEAEVLSGFFEACAAGKPVQTIELRRRIADGRGKDLVLKFVPVRARTGEPLA